MSVSPCREAIVASLPSPGGALGAVLPSAANYGPEPQRSVPRASISSENQPVIGAPAGWKLPPSVASCLAGRLDERWETYRKELRNCQETFSENTVHDFRVASRRLLAQLVMLSCIAPGETAEKARRQVKRGLRALSELRDFQVQRSFVEHQLTRYPELLLLRDYLRRQERRLEKAAAGSLRRFRARRLERGVASLEQALVTKQLQARCSARLTTAVGEAFRDVVRRRQAIVPQQPETIHRTRVAFKKFRYMVESLSPEFTGLNKRQLRRLADYQRRMGILQDLEVMQRLLTVFVHEHPGIGPLLQRFARYLKQRRARALRSFLQAADQCYGFWPPTVARAGTALAARCAA